MKLGKRLSKIYTRTGDAGETGLGDGSRISKRHPRLEAIGNVDELNSVIGVLIEDLREQSDSVTSLAPALEFLRDCQHRIFDVGGELSIPGYAIINETHTETIERALDKLNADLPPLDNFILPGGSRLIANAHLARAVCRRAERSVVALGEETQINPHGLTFLNRLSDYLFVLARYTASVTQVEEVLWEK